MQYSVPANIINRIVTIPVGYGNGWIRKTRNAVASWIISSVFVGRIYKKIRPILQRKV